jgi:hypothetical protein
VQSHRLPFSCLTVRKNQEYAAAWMFFKQIQSKTGKEGQKKWEKF